MQPLLKSAVASTGCQRQNNAAHRRLPSFRAWAFLRAEARGCHTPHRRFRLLTGSWAMLGARYRSLTINPAPQTGKITPAGAQPGRRHCSARSRRAESRSIRRRSWAPTTGETPCSHPDCLAIAVADGWARVILRANVSMRVSSLCTCAIVPCAIGPRLCPLLPAAGSTWPRWPQDAEPPPMPAPT